MDISKKTFIWAVTGLILLRVILVILVMNNVPFTDMQLGGFRPHFGGQYWPDEQKFFDMTLGFVADRAVAEVPNIGMPLFLVPIVYFSKAGSIIDIVKPVFIVEAFILLPLAIILIALIAEKLFNSRILALFSALLFTIYPWLLLGFGKIIHYASAVPAFHYQLWITIGSDYISALLVYLSFYLFLKWSDSFLLEPGLNFRRIIILAVVSGASLLVRITNIWAALIFIGAFLYFRKFKMAGLYSLASAVVFLPQLIYNQAAFGAFWSFSYVNQKLGYSNHFLLFKVSNLWNNFQHFSPGHYFLWFLAAAAFFLIIYILGFKYLKKNNALFTRIAAGWFWSYLLFYGAFTFSTQSLRYFLPAIPVFIYFLVAAIVYLTTRLKLSCR